MTPDLTRLTSSVCVLVSALVMLPNIHHNAGVLDRDSIHDEPAHAAVSYLAASAITIVFMASGMCAGAEKR